MTAVQEDLRFDPPPAQPKTGDLPVTGRGEVPDCSSCEDRPATMKAYYAELGRAAQLLPWCAVCCSRYAHKVAAAGFSLTLLPLEPLPTYDEIVRQLDRAETEPDTYLRRQYGPRGPRPQRGRYV
jgi:hypothetical protein